VSSYLGPNAWTCQVLPDRQFSAPSNSPRGQGCLKQLAQREPAHLSLVSRLPQVVQKTLLVEG